MDQTTKTIPNYEAFKYVEVWEIKATYKNQITQIESIGFAHRDRPKQENEIYSSLSTKLTKQNQITLNPYL